MNGTLLDAFRHNSWATRELLAACQDLTTEQLTSGGNGSFGSILETFNHIIFSDAGYARRLSNSFPTWAANKEETTDLDQLGARAEEVGRIWDQALAEPIDAEQVMILDEGAYETHLGVIIAQALYHGSAHREQICTTLTNLGIEPPDVQVWAYAEATGRGRERHPDS